MTAPADVPRAPADWDARGTAALREAVRRIFRGEEVPTEPWASLAEHYRRWSAEEAFPPELTPYGHALGRVAVVAARPLEEAQSAHKALAADAEKQCPHRLAEVLLERRRLPPDGPDRPKGLGRLAEALYQLVTCVESDAAMKPALGAVVMTYAEAVDAHLGRNQLEGAANAASSVIACINTYGLAEHFDRALAWGRELVLLPRQSGNAVSVGSLLVCNNLISTCSALARLRQGNAGDYFELGTTFSRTLLEGIKRCPGADENPSLKREMQAAGHRGIIFGQMGLLQLDPSRFGKIGPSVWDRILDYEAFARKSGDPDQRADVAELKQKVYAYLHHLHPLQVKLFARRTDDDPVAATQGLEARLDSARAAAAAVVRQVLTAAVGDRQEAVLERAVSDCYGPIDKALKVVVEELGLNLHVCRVFAAIGGIASGRLLPSAFILNWLLPLNENEIKPRGRQLTLFKNQTAFARWRMRAEVDLLLGVTRLASLVEGVQPQRELAARLRSLLRAQNARLLASAAVATECFEGRTLSADDDIRNLVSDASPDAARQFWQGYASRTGSQAS